MSESRTGAEARATQDAVVVAWRRGQLLAAGFGSDLSAELARDCGVDLHDLLELVERGSEPAIAAQILAPFDGESRSC